MKKLIFVISVMFICALSVDAKALNIFDNEISGIPSEWTVTSTPKGKAAAEIGTDGKISLSFDTTDEAAKGNARIITGYYSAQDEQLFLSTVIDAELSEDAQVSLQIMDSSAQNKTDLMSVTKTDGGAQAVFFAGECTYIMNGKTEIRFVINTKTAYGSVFAGDGTEPLFTGIISGWKTIDLENIRFLLQLSGTAKSARKASVSFEDFTAKAFGGAYSFSSFPEHMEKMLDVSVTKQIDISFGTAVDRATLNKENAELYENGESVGFNIISDESSMSVIPDGGLKSNAGYKLVLKRIADIYGVVKEQNKEISFTTADEAYTAPEISIFPEKTDIVAGESTGIRFEIKCEEHSVTEIFVNDEPRTGFEGNVFVYKFSSDESGIYKIRAKTVDDPGGVGISEVITVNVGANDPPKLKISGIEDNRTYNAGNGELTVITAAAEDDNGIGGISVYVDGWLLKQTASGALELDMKELPSGSHKIKFTAEDKYKFTADAVYNITIVSDSLIYYAFYDYEDYIGKDTVPSGHQGGAQRGYLDARTIDTDHGISAIIGMDEVNEEFAVGNGSYIGFPMNGTANKFSIEMDLYIETPPTGDDPYKIMIRGSGGAASLAEIQPRQIWCQTGGASPYTPGEWTKIKFVFDKVNQRFEYYADGKKIGGYKELASNIGAYTWLRIFSPNYDNVKTFAAVDNVRVTIISEAPQIVMTSNVYEPDTDSISFSVKGDLDTQTITGSRLTIESGHGTVGISSVSMNGDTVTVRLAQKLEENTEYRLSISGDARYSTGEKIGQSTSALFKTSGRETDITNAGYVRSNGVLSFEFSAKNSSENDRYIYILTQNIINGRAESSKLNRVTVSAGGKAETFSIPQSLPSDGEKIETFILNGLDVPLLVVGMPYTY